MATDQHQKRAEWGIRIARVKLGMQLKQEIRGDNYSARADAMVSELGDALDAVLAKTTPANIQTCKAWVMQHVSPHSTVAHKVAEFLVAVSKAHPMDQGAKRTWVARKRLAVLLVVSDILHADTYHKKNQYVTPTFQIAWKPEIEELVECAAEAIAVKDTNHESKLKALINLWASSECIDANHYECLRERFADGRAVARGDTPTRKRTYKLPEVFGDSRLPWYEQPSSYMLQPLIEHPEQPILTSKIVPQKLGTREASKEVRALIDEFFDNIDLHFVPTGDNPTGETRQYKLWYDPLGQLWKEDKATSESKMVCNAYGWSPRFCQDMHDLGLPSTINKKRMAHIEKTQLLEAQQQEEAEWLFARSSPTISPSPPRRRPRSISPSSSDRSSDGERPGSRNSGDDRRPRRSSRDNGDPYRHRRSPLDEDNPYERQSRFDDAQRDHLPPNQYGRGLHHSDQRWNNRNNSRADRDNFFARGNNNSTNHTQGFPQAPQAFVSARPGPHPPPPPPPPMQGQFSGQPFAQPNQYAFGGQVPPPPHMQPPGGAPPPPPPPPTYNAAYNHMSNMSGQSGNPHFQGGNNYNNNYNNGGNYGGYPQHQRGFGGGYQGRGGNRGGNRGGYRGGHQGQWGNRGRY